MFRIFQALFLFALLPCCSHYTRDFSREVAAAPNPPTDPTGPWEGRWLSSHNGHEGPLWCIVSPQPGKPGTYQFRYRAGWAGFRFGDFTHATPVQSQRDGTFLLDSAMELPAGLGTYSVEGRLSATQFDARYQSDKGDHGNMSLGRP